MKMGFKTFILDEDAKASHALKFLEYEHHDHIETFKKIKVEIEKVWEKTVTSFLKKNSIPEIDSDDPKMKAMYEILLVK